MAVFSALVDLLPPLAQALASIIRQSARVFQKHARASAAPEESRTVALKRNVESERLAGLTDHRDPHKAIERKATEMKDIFRGKVDDVALVRSAAIEKKPIVVAPRRDIGKAQRPQVGHLARQRVALNLGVGVSMEEHLRHERHTSHRRGSLGVGLGVEHTIGGMIRGKKALLPIFAIYI